MEVGEILWTKDFSALYEFAPWSAATSKFCALTQRHPPERKASDRLADIVRLTDRKKFEDAPISRQLLGGVDKFEPVSSGGEIGHAEEAVG